MQQNKANLFHISFQKDRSHTLIARVVNYSTLLMLLVGVGITAKYLLTTDDSYLRHFNIFLYDALVYNFVGLLILKHHPRHTVGWLFIIIGFTAGINFMGGSYFGFFGEELLRNNPELAKSWIKNIGDMIWWPVLVLPITLVPLYFPDGKLPSKRWRVVVAATVLGLLFGILSAFHTEPILVWKFTEHQAENKKAIDGLLEILVSTSFPLLLFGALGGLGAVFYRLRRVTDVERLQMKWLLYSASIVIALSLFFSITGWVIPYNQAYEDFNNMVSSAMMMLIPISCGIAIVKHGLWDIDIIINRTLVYGGLTMMVTAIYITIVGGTAWIFQGQIGTLSSFVAALVIAVVFQPVREQLQTRVNRLMYGERDNPAVVLTRLAHHSETAETPADILPNLAQNITELLKIPYVAIRLPAGMGQKISIASWGERSDHFQTIPITFQKETIGELVVAQRGPQEQFNQDEQDLLTTIAALTATTVRAVQLSDELRWSRQRIVTAREEERRRLRRDLHDGLGPQLASQVLGLEAVAQLMPSDPEKAQSLLDSLKTQAQEAFLDVRRLVYDLRPPALDDLGLIGALKQSASRYETGVLRFGFDVSERLPDLPAAVETAAYRIAQEAMTNVVRHADATHCALRLFCDDTHIIVEVSDNGRGLSQNHQTGVGLQAMKERTTELNGEFLLESLPDGGTLVQARLPLEVYGE